MQKVRTSLFVLPFALIASVSVSADNRIVVSDATLPLSSSGHVIAITIDADQDILGFSVYLEFRPDRLSVQEVQLGSDIQPLSPEWHDGEIDNTAGQLRYGVVCDLSGPTLTKKISAGEGIEVLRLVVDVEATSAGTTALDLRDIVTSDPRRVNILTDENGDTISPEQIDGEVTISDLRPVIETFEGNEGEAGKQFFVVGQNFDQPGLLVRVCGKQVTANLLPDDQTLQVIAPACAAGPAEVEVCTDYGCDSDPSGFLYPLPPEGPVIENIQGGEGVAGDEFYVVGQNFDQPGLRVLVCGLEAEGSLLGDNQSFLAVAPACGSTGPARVEVCTDFGCDFVEGGFVYEGTPEDLFLRGDSNLDGNSDLSDGVYTLNYLFLGGATPRCLDAADANDSGDLDLTDAIFTFNFLFLGGETIRPPYPDCGVDTTDDGLGCAEPPAACR